MQKAKGAVQDDEEAGKTSDEAQHREDYSSLLFLQQQLVLLACF